MFRNSSAVREWLWKNERRSRLVKDFMRFIFGVCRLALVTLALGWALQAQAQEIPVWDLTRLVQEATRHHPSILNAQRLADAADVDVAYAQRQRYPELSVNSLSQSSGTTAAVVIRQPLWSGGAIDAAEDVSRASAEMQKTTAQEQALTIGTRVVEAWQNYLLSVEKTAIVDQGIEQLEDLVAMMERRVDARISPKVELELAKARVIQAQIGRASLVAERDLALKRLRELVGVEITAADRLNQDQMQVWLEAIHRSVDLPSVTELEQIARYQPTVRRVQFEASVAQAEVKRIEASRWPSLYLQYQQGINEPITNDKKVGLALEYTPGRGFSSREQVQSAIARAQARDINIQTAIRDARDSLNAKMQELSRTRALERSWVPAVAASEQLLASYRRQFIAGRKSWQDVLGQQNDLTQGRQSLVDARVRWISTYVQLRLQWAAKPGGSLISEDWAQALTREQDNMARGGGSLNGAVLANQTKANSVSLMSSVVEGKTMPPSAPLASIQKPAENQPSTSSSQVRNARGAWAVTWLADEVFASQALGQIKLSASGVDQMRSWRAAMPQAPGQMDEIRVIAYSDPLGEPSEVLARSKEMALVVTEALKAQGLRAQSWKTEWLGATQPKNVRCGFEKTVANQACHRVNRRVVVELLPNVQALNGAANRGNR